MESLKFLDQVRDVVRINHFSQNTEKIYLGWISRFLSFSENKPIQKMDKGDVDKFLLYLAKERKVSSATQNQALNALVFVFREVLKISFDRTDIKTAPIRQQLPEVLSLEEVKKVLSCLQGEADLMVSVLYGSGLRLTECLKLRVKDINFNRNEILVFGRDEDMDRKTVLPNILVPRLKRQIEKVKIRWEENQLLTEFDGATMTERWIRKFYSSRNEINWQYVFPAIKNTVDKRDGKIKQHHCHQNFLQNAVKEANKKVQINKNVSCRTFRHSFATHLLEYGYDIRTVQKLLGHKDVRTTMKYNYMVEKHMFNVRSPLDVCSYPQCSF